MATISTRPLHSVWPLWTRIATACEHCSSGECAKMSFGSGCVRCSTRSSSARLRPPPRPRHRHARRHTVNHRVSAIRSRNWSRCPSRSTTSTPCNSPANVCTTRCGSWSRWLAASRKNSGNGFAFASPSLIRLVFSSAHSFACAPTHHTDVALFSCIMH